jgi:hypothetical protein
VAKMLTTQLDRSRTITIYEFHGSIRIEANSEEEAVAILDSIEKANANVGCEIHTNDMEEVE